MYYRGLRVACIREVQKDLRQSAKLLIEDRLRHYGLLTGQGFRVFRDVIQTPGDGLITFHGMADYNSESIKSLEGYDRAWFEESQNCSERSLQLLRPTIRKKDSEMWFTWNPRRKVDPVDAMFRQSKPPTDAILVRANWDDNPWFNETRMPQERVDCLENDPDQYDHVWSGQYIGVSKGAYYAKQLAKARAEGRIGKVAEDALLPVRLLCDIGGTGKTSDAFTMWAQQWVSQEIRQLKYYEAQGQEWSHHVNWMRENGYTPERAIIILPHDGKTHDKVHKVSYQSAFEDAGYTVEVIPNQGTGAAMLRVQAARRLMPQMYFDEEGCEGGLETLAWYHPKFHKVTGMDLGPDHDWSSHGADAFGLGAVAHQVPARPPVDIDFVGWG